MDWLFSQRMTQIRAAILAVIALVSGFGLLPADAADVVAENWEQVLAGAAALWSVLAYLTGKAKSGGAG